MTMFSLNLNKVALVRNSRGTETPNLLEFANKRIQEGVRGITVHPRPDQRHTKFTDVFELSDMIRPIEHVEFNVEGNPTPEFLELVLKSKPNQCTLVPDKPGQLTSDHGFDLHHDGELLIPILKRLRDAGIRSSIFLDPVVSQVQLAKVVGADRIELYTESYAKNFATPRQDEILQQYIDAGNTAKEIGIGLNAGHDLNLQNLDLFLKSVPHVLEVSIGHAAVCEAWELSFPEVVRQYLEIVQKYQ